jgi:hypothetical protein
MMIEWLAGDKVGLHPKMACEKVTVHAVKNYLHEDGSRKTRVLLVVHFNEEQTTVIKRDFPGLYRIMGMFPVYIVGPSKWGFEAAFEHAVELLADTPLTTETPGVAFDEKVDGLIARCRQFRETQEEAHVT